MINCEVQEDCDIYVERERKISRVITKGGAEVQIWFSHGSIITRNTQSLLNNLFLKLVEIFNKKSILAVARLNLAKWYDEVEAFGDNHFNKVLETFENHNTSIINYFEQRLTYASAEYFNAKIKAF